MSYQNTCIRHPYFILCYWWAAVQSSLQVFTQRCHLLLLLLLHRVVTGCHFLNWGLPVLQLILETWKLIFYTVLSRFSKITKSVIFIPEISLLASSTIFFCSVSGAWSFALIAVTLFSVAVSLVFILKHHRGWDFQWKAWAVSCTRLCLLVEISENFLNWEQFAESKLFSYSNDFC